MQLGPRLAEMGRFPEVRPYLQLRMPALLHWYAAPQAQISPEVVPFRPHRGVVVIVEEPVGDDVASWLQWLHTDHYPAVLATPGVAGAWMYGTTNTWKLHPATQGDAAVHHGDLPRRRSARDDEGTRAARRGALADRDAVRPLFAGRSGR